MMGEQHVARLNAEPLGSRDQWRHRSTGIHEEGRSAVTLGHEEGVRKELVVHRSLDDHHGHTYTKQRGDAMALIHTCYRITDIERSVAFYNALGFEEVGRIPIRDEAINVFMSQPGDGDMPRLELTYNFGVDSYEIGSGYGHIAITASDLDGTLARLAEQGIEPEKPPYSVREGGSRLCFVKDPDGYRIEIIEQPSVAETKG
jgi:lactoylglutathione lyase